MLWPFSRVTTPDRVTSADFLAYAHGIGRSGRVPSSTTVGARIACLSSFYRFTIRMGLLIANPCDALERPRSVPSIARGYSADEVRRLLAVVPDTVRGRRDRAILLVLVLTGRRRAEVIGLRAGDLSLESENVFYTYRVRRYLAAARFKPTGLHVLRHTAAKLRRDAGASIAVTTVYLRRLEGEADRTWSDVAAAIGVQVELGRILRRARGGAVTLWRSGRATGCHGSRPSPRPAGACEEDRWLATHCWSSPTAT